MSDEKRLQADQSGILSVEQQEELLRPISEHVAAIQEKIDALRVEGTDKVLSLRRHMELIRNDRNFSKSEKADIVAEDKKALKAALALEAKNKAEINALIKEAEDYLKANYRSQYYEPVVESLKKAKLQAIEEHKKHLATLFREHKENLARIRSEHKPEMQQEIKDENYVYKNRLFDAKMMHKKALQEIKDNRHRAFVEQYHMIDLLRMSKFTFAQKQAQKWELRRYSFNNKEFFLKNGLYLVIILIFILLCFLAPILKNTRLLTANNVLNILQQASPRIFLALGVAGLILLTGTDLSIGRMVGMGMVTSTVIMHRGVNTGSIFGHIFDFTHMPLIGRAFLALFVGIVLSVLFTSLAGFFTAKYKMHPFISTMSNMLIIFGLVTYATKGVSFGAIEPAIKETFIPTIKGFPTIIAWAVAAIIIIWFIWNKTRFGKYLYAVGGNPEAAAVSGISVFWVTMGAFMMAGVLYGFGSWLECLRMTGSGSAAYGQGWDMDAIAACVVGGVSFTGGIGKISGVVVGVMIFTALTYSLTVLGIDTNLQFVFEGIIILTAVTLDCLKYVRKK